MRYENEFEQEESRRSLEHSVEDLLAALYEKHGEGGGTGFLKILIWGDGSGRIYDGPMYSDEGKPMDENILFRFEGKEELSDWLNSGPIPEPTERE
jgi:hypothetical protein